MQQPALLGGVDVFHLVNDRAMRVRGLPGNHCVFVVDLAGTLDHGAIEARLERARRLVPELSFRLAGFPGPLRWVETRGLPARAVEVVRVSTELEREAALASLLARRVDGAAPWAVDIVRQEGSSPRDTLLFRWFHPLTDAKGAERIVRWLGSGGDEGPEPPAPEEDRFATSDSPLAKLDRAALMTLMRGYNAHVLGLARTPTRSLATGAPRRLGATVAHRITLTQEQTAAFDRRVRKEARLAETSVMILASARAVDQVLLGRGHAVPQHLVPVPLSLDPKGGSRRLFGNHLTMMMLALDRDDLRDDARAVQHLAEQQRAVVRDKLDLGMASALKLASRLPWPVHHWLTTQPFRGEMGSFVFSNPGAVTLSSFAGLSVQDAYALPAVVSPPGLQVIFSRFGGRLSALVVHVESALPPPEAAVLLRTLRSELVRDG